MNNSSWHLTYDAGKPRIRRKRNGKWETYPAKKFRDFTQEQLNDLVIRLNNKSPEEARIRAKLDLDHAYISPNLLFQYFEHLCQEIPSQKNARRNFGYLQRHVLGFFVKTHKIRDPQNWHKAQDRWAKYLTERKLSGAAIRQIVIEANRFVAWLHKERPDEVPPLKFQPINRARMKYLEAQRELDGEVKERKIVQESDWKKIVKTCPAELAPFIQLGANYGLRRAESLGVTPDALRKGYLVISKQYVGSDQYRPLKGRDHRKIPHWFSGPALAYEWIEAAQKLLMHPDTLTHKWADLMQKLGMDYDFHDLRHTFITKAIRQYAPRDVQLAAGHKNMETTMRYSHDDRALDDEPFDPKAA